MKLRDITFAFLLIFSFSSAIAEEDLYQPVEANESEEYSFRILSSSSYTDENGRQVLDVIEGSQSYFALSVETMEGDPVIGVNPEFKITGTSVMMEPSQAAPLKATDNSGILEFGVVAGVQGMDQITVTYGKNTASLNINIISLNIHNYAALPELAGGLSWSELMEASLDFEDGKMLASFPANLVRQSGKQVDIIGYMLPLDTDTKQKHFLLTSAPPSCFYHIPGGPAGVVEVFSEDGIEASWSPITLTGTLVLVDTSLTGVIYQLEGATVLED